MASKKISDLPESKMAQLLTTDYFELSTINDNKIRQSKKTTLSEIAKAIFSKMVVDDNGTIKTQISNLQNRNKFETIIMTETDSSGVVHEYRLHIKNGNLVIDNESDYNFIQEMRGYMDEVNKPNEIEYNYDLIYREANASVPEGFQAQEIKNMKTYGDKLKVYAYGDAEHGVAVLQAKDRKNWDDTRRDFEPLFLQIRYATNHDEPYKIILSTKQDKEEKFTSCKDKIKELVDLPKIEEYDSARYELYDVFVLDYGESILYPRLNNAVTDYTTGRQQTPERFNTLEKANEDFKKYVDDLNLIQVFLMDDGTTATELGYNSYLKFYEDNKNNEDQNIKDDLEIFKTNLNDCLRAIKKYLPNCKDESTSTEVKENRDQAIKLITTLRGQYDSIKYKIDHQ